MSSCDISFRLKKIKDRNIITKLEYTVITKNVATFSLRLWEKHENTLYIPSTVFKD